MKEFDKCLPLNAGAVIVVQDSIYQSAHLRHTITYDRLRKKCKPNLNQEELFAILLHVDDKEYKKHRIHLIAMAVQDREFRYPLWELFELALKGKPCIDHRDLSLTDIFLLEKERTVNFVREMNKPKGPTHNLW